MGMRSGRLRRLLATVGVGLFVVAGVATARPATASAATCGNTSGYGIVTFGTINLPQSGTYYLWSRISVPLAGEGYQIEINGSLCYHMTTNTLNDWAWTNSNNGTPSVFEFDSATGNSVRLIGLAPGVRVDRIAVCKDPNFVPSGLGEGCTTALPDSVVLSNGGGLPTPPDNNHPVAGKVNPSNTLATSDISQVAHVEYFMDGTKLQSSNGAQPLDTTLLKNGKHTVETKVTFNDGSSTTDVSVITVNNPENLRTPVVRWIRLNQRGVTIFGGAALLVVLLFGGFTLSRYLYLRRRLMHFHGF